MTQNKINISSFPRTVHTYPTICLSSRTARTFSSIFILVLLFYLIFLISSTRSKKFSPLYHTIFLIISLYLFLLLLLLSPSPLLIAQYLVLLLHDRFLIEDRRILLSLDHSLQIISYIAKLK